MMDKFNEVMQSVFIVSVKRTRVDAYDEQHNIPSAVAEEYT